MKKLVAKAKKVEQVKQEPEIEYNNYEYEFYKQHAPAHMPDHYSDENNRYDIHRFLAAVDKSKGIRRKVSRMYRIKALDFLGNPDKPVRKEFLTVVEDWYGKRVDGTELPPVSEHKNGVYPELVLKNGIPEPTNNLIYYIPFNKENVDEWVEQSWSTDKETIQFWVDTKQGSKRKQFEYDDFVNKKWDDLVAIIDKPRSAGANTDGLVELINRQQKQIEELIEQNKQKSKQK